MKRNRVLLWLVKLSLIDEILAIIYWGLVLYGLFKGISTLADTGWGFGLLSLVGVAYVVIAVVMYIWLVKRLGRVCTDGGASRE